MLTAPTPPILKNASSNLSPLVKVNIVGGKVTLSARSAPDVELADELLSKVSLLFNIIYPPAFPDGGVATGHGMQLMYIIPLILGIMMLLSVFSKFGWFARWGIAYVVGMAAGLRSYGFLNSNVIGQIKGSVIPLAGDVSTGAIINGIILLVGTVTGLMYFYFSKEHKGWFGTVGRIGIYFLMISFGASFGFAVMGRISLLIGRFTDLITYGSDNYHHASLWLLVIMVVLLGLWSFFNKEEKTI